MSCAELRGTPQGVRRHRLARTPPCEDCRHAAAAERMLYRVLRGDQKGFKVPLQVLGELLRCATPEVMELAREMLPYGVPAAAEAFLQRQARLATEEEQAMEINHPTMRCPDCGHDADSQGGTSYYACGGCGTEFDREELDSEGNYKDTGDGWDEEE